MKKTFFLTLVISIVCMCSICTAQYWAKTYGGESEDQAYYIQQTTDSGYVVAGITYSFGVGYYDFWILKLDSNGEISWQKAYGDTHQDQPTCIRQTSDGGYIVAGSIVFDWSDAYHDLWVLKLNSEGNIIWQKTYGGSGVDAASSIEQTTDGGYIVAGSTSSFGVGGMDIWVLKLDTSGNVTWQKTYGGSDTDWANSIQQTTDGGYIVAGYKGIGGLFDELDVLVMKLDSNGNTSWQKTYRLDETDIAESIQQTTDGGFIVAGRTTGPYGGYSDFLILKLDNNGNVTWHRTYGGSGWKAAHSILQTTDGGYVVAGGDGDALLIKLDADGNIAWQKTYGGSKNDEAHSMQQTLDGGYIVAGESASFGEGSYDFWVLKLDSSGKIPNCNITGNGNTIATDNSVSVENTYITSQSSNAMISNTNITPLNTSSIRLITCCYDDIHDYDNDGLGDACDNCLNNSNPNQEDYDEDGLGDICDECIDTDRDGYGNPQFPENTCADDNCPDDYNPDQSDYDEDEIGDVCDNCLVTANTDQSEVDRDGVGDVCDNCPEDYNPGQEDNDLDNLGDICDPDDDNDVICDPGESDPSCSGSDNCPLTFNSGQEDIGDSDGVGDVCDNCPEDYNPGQEDNDQDGLGDACDSDDDNDGILDNEDNCPKTPNGPNGGICTSGRLIGQTCRYAFDCFSLGWEEGGDCSNNQEDYDSDSIGDVCDNCPFISNLDQLDTDEDGYGDACDAIVLDGTQWESFVIPSKLRSGRRGKATVMFFEGDTALIRWDNEYSTRMDFRYYEKVSFGNTVFFTMDGFSWWMDSVGGTVAVDGFGWGIAGINTGITMVIQLYSSDDYIVFGFPEK